MAKGRNSKASNGEGQTITVTGFDLNDPQEQRALAMSQLLATKHGRRKQVIVALLDAMYQHYNATGEIMSGSEVYQRVIGGTAPASTLLPPPPARRAEQPPAPKKEKRVKVEKVNTSDRAAQIAAATVASGVGWFDD